MNYKAIAVGQNGFDFVCRFSVEEITAKYHVYVPQEVMQVQRLLLIK
jgi:hypothetical protein